MQTTNDTIKLQRKTWKLGERINGGGFGQVYAVVSGRTKAVAKLVPKAPGADRELLFVDLGDIRNVVPVIDSGEHRDYWVLIMPRADLSLREHLEQADGPLAVTDAVNILRDVCDALTDLNGKVVHRDLKPENILRLDGKWCLADFGISRYAEATTAPDTKKFALSPPYAAPERWRSERAEAATDVYAVGVIAYEMLTRERPFGGPSVEDFREQHLHADAPHVEGVPSAFAALIDECLYKAAAARPTPANLRARLDRVTASPESPGVARLQQANQAAVRRLSEASRRQSEARTEAERRDELAKAAQQGFEQIFFDLRETITQAAPAAKATRSARGDWSIQLNQATLSLSSISQRPKDAWGGWDAPIFDVICAASLHLKISANYQGYEGRSHSLWFGDIQEEDSYGWFETAFMVSGFMAQRGSQFPFALDPGEGAAKAVWAGMAEFQVAWPFTSLMVGDLGEFLDRWAGWFADAANGRLQYPRRMPERSPHGSWRSGRRSTNSH